MSEHHTETAPQSSSSNGLVPALVFFAGITAVLLILTLTRQPPSEEAVVAAVSTATAAVPTEVPPTATPMLEPTAVPVEPTAAPVEPTAAPAEATAAVEAPAGGDAAPVAVVELDRVRVTRGEQAYNGICSACHGGNATGLPGLGKSLVGTDFIRNQTDEELVQFINVGRLSSDPENTTGVTMPGKGGNPALSDDDLLNIVQYLRSLDPNRNSPSASADAAAGAHATNVAPGAGTPTSEPYQFVPLIQLPTATPREAYEFVPLIQLPTATPRVTQAP